MKKIARPDMASQNFYPWSLTFDHVLFEFDVSHVANVATIHDSIRSSIEISAFIH
jgi:hypothetical protein